MSGHTHTCRVCAFETRCVFSRRDCRTKGVLAAVRVNGDEPICFLCANLELARRAAKLRGLQLVAYTRRLS